MYNEPILKRKKIQSKGFYIALIAFALILTLGLSYAFFIYKEEGNNHVAVAGNIFMESTNSDDISLIGLYPMNDEEGIENGIKYNFDVSGYNLSDKTIYYGIYINEGDEITGKTRFKDDEIKLYLTKTIDSETTVVYGPNTLENFNRTMIYTSTIEPNISKENTINISYELTIWIDEKILISDTVTSMEGRTIYTSEEYKNSYASVKVEVYGDFQEKELPIIGYITYDMSSLGISNPASTPIYSDNTGTVTSEVTSTTLTNFLGWSTTEDGEVVYQPGDSINASDIVNGNLTLYPVMEVVADTTKPVCVISDWSISCISMVNNDVYQNYDTYTINCTDESDFNDSTIDASDFVFSTDGVVEISDITTSEITSGYQYTITVTSISEGTTTLTLNSGVVSDSAGNTNDSVTSSSIIVSDWCSAAAGGGE